MKFIYKAFARITGKNPKSMPLDVIVGQMNEARPLPMGRKEFDEWSNRIISGAMLQADVPSLKFALAEMIMHIKPTESHCADAYFIHCLRKGAANQVAFSVMNEIRDERKAELAKIEEQKKVAEAQSAITIQPVNQVTVTS